jgi:hypothetical protein
VLDLLATVARPTPSPGISLWQVVGAVAAAVGLLAGIQQLAHSFRRRRFRQAEERVSRRLPYLSMQRLHSVTTTIMRPYATFFGSKSRMRCPGRQCGST